MSEYAKTRPTFGGGQERVRCVGTLLVVLGFALEGTGVNVYLYEEIGGGREYLYNETFNNAGAEFARAHIRAERLQHWQRGCVERERARA